MVEVGDVEPEGVASMGGGGLTGEEIVGAGYVRGKGGAGIEFSGVEGWGGRKSCSWNNTSLERTTEDASVMSLITYQPLFWIICPSMSP